MFEVLKDSEMNLVIGGECTCRCLIESSFFSEQEKIAGSEVKCYGCTVYHYPAPVANEALCRAVCAGLNPPGIMFTCV